jgi:magnesium transporter
MDPTQSHAKLKASLEQIAALLQRHKVLETWTHNQAGQTEQQRELLESLVHRQNLAELRHKLHRMHPADIGYVLEALPADDRRLVWEQLDAPMAGAALPEVSRNVCEGLVEDTPRERLMGVLAHMDAEDFGHVSAALPREVLDEAFRARDEGERSWLISSTSFPEGSVGRLMIQDFVPVRDTLTVGDAIKEVRARPSLPRQIDSVFVVDARNVLRGLVPMRSLLVHDPARPIVETMAADLVVFGPGEKADQAAEAFGRYDLVCAPVVDDRSKLIGALTVDAVVDYIEARAGIRALQSAGLRGEEDLFSSVWDSARNRWLWLFTNLVTAFVASRVIGFFEATIERVVALATLMPVVASVGGNTGNQTVALVIRSLALGQVTLANARHLVMKELTISVLNGVVWGSLMGLFAYVLYGVAQIGMVMAAAILLNLMAAALVGVAVPLVLHRSGRDPAHGSSVLLTFATDGLGFLIFLGLATAVLR